MNNKIQWAVIILGLTLVGYHAINGFSFMSGEVYKTPVHDIDVLAVQND
jgi:hypothetical protein